MWLMEAKNVARLLLAYSHLCHHGSDCALSSEKLLYSLEYIGCDLKLVRMVVPLKDTKNRDLLYYLEICIDFIDCNKNEGLVLVHCFAGISRRFHTLLLLSINLCILWVHFFIQYSREQLRKLVWSQRNFKGFQSCRRQWKARTLRMSNLMTPPRWWSPFLDIVSTMAQKAEASASPSLRFSTSQPRCHQKK